MGTEILRPLNFFWEPIGIPLAELSRRSSSYVNCCYDSHHCRSNRRPTVRSDLPERRRRNPSIYRRLSPDDVKIAKMTILRRGESLDSKIKSNTTRRQEGEALTPKGTERIGPDPEMVPKQIRIVDTRPPVTGKCEVYAGSGFSMSPSPRSVPLPSFQKRRQGWKMDDESATKDLRRLLRLDA